MTITFGSLNTSRPITLRSIDANDVVAPVDLTDMTLEVRFYDVGHIGQGGSRDDYGSTPSGATPLLTLAMNESGDPQDGGLFVDDAENGVVYYVLTAANAAQLANYSSVTPTTARRRLVRQIWRTDSGAEAMLDQATEWAQP